MISIPAAIEPDRFLERYETALVRIPFEWNVAEPYRIGLTIEDGTRFEKEIEAAAPALEPSLELVGFFCNNWHLRWNHTCNDWITLASIYQKD